MLNASAVMLTVVAAVLTVELFEEIGSASAAILNDQESESFHKNPRKQAPDRLPGPFPLKRMEPPFGTDSTLRSISSGTGRGRGRCMN